jgi:MFS family permease
MRLRYRSLVVVHFEVRRRSHTVRMPIIDSRRRGVFTGLLFSTMGVGTFVALSLGILAVVFIEDLGITRAQLGLVFAVNTVGAAVLSPLVGRVTDRIGGRGALVIVACAAAVAFLLLGAAQSLGVLVAGSMIGAIAQAGSNPATNKLIAEDLPVGSQGLVTGIKQSGVQAFVFVGGMTVPAVALAWGRSSAYVALASFAVLVGAFAIWFLPRSTNTAASPPTHRTGRLPSAIWWITGYGFLLGISGSATVLFALFTTESLGQSIVAGGAVTAVVGLASMPARILWARHAEKHDAYRSSLVIIALLGVGASLLLMVAGHGPWWLIWVAALLTGIGPSSWNSVGMLGLIVFAGPAKAGRASGVVLSGFLVGLGIGPPFFGWIVDTTGDYTSVWIASMVTALLGFVTMLMWSPKDRPS